MLLNATFPTNPVPIKYNHAVTVTFLAAISLHERDSDILWSRTDNINYARYTRYDHELVATWNAWLGN